MRDYRDPRYRKRLSKAGRKAAQARAAKLPMPRQGLRRCSQCRAWKTYDANDPAESEFPINRSRAANPVTGSFAVNSWCRACRRKAGRRDYTLNREARKRRVAERYSEDPERFRAEARERYHREVRETRKEYVDPAPFLMWMEERGIQTPSGTLDAEARRIRDVKARRADRLSLDLIDRVLVHFGEEHLLQEWYPL